MRTRKPNSERDKQPIQWGLNTKVDVENLIDIALEGGVQLKELFQTKEERYKARQDRRKEEEATEIIDGTEL